MSQVADIKDVPTCILRAKEHAKLADVLFETKQEWAAVCGFYSAYHLMRAALLSDPIFDDAHRLSEKSDKIRPEDRFVSKHSKGGLSSTSYGLNEIVSVLYVEFRARYYRLHIASNAVRYGRGLEALRLPELKKDLEQITQAFEVGKLVCP